MATIPSVDTGVTLRQPIDFKLFTAFLCVWLVFAGCSYRTQVKVRGEYLSSSDGTILCQEIANATPLNSFRALVKASFHTPDGVQTARYAVLFQAPASVRIELLPTSGFYALGVLAGKNSEGFTYLDVVRKEGIKTENFGDISETIFQGMRLEINDLVSVVSGALPTQICSGDIVVRVDKERESAYLESKSQERIWEVDLKSKQIKSLVVIDRYSDNHELEFVRKRDAESDTVDVIAPLLDLTGEMNFLKLEKNVLIPSRLFTVDFPSDYHLLKEK